MDATTYAARLLTRGGAALQVVRMGSDPNGVPNSRAPRGTPRGDASTGALAKSDYVARAPGFRLEAPARSAE
ncbi:MAG TPA: hypothetical protein VL484_02020 [Vicinamibacterales bacterium]|nr:hypothetical protein [Vicinamibacterales bacterium]